MLEETVDDITARLNSIAMQVVELEQTDLRGMANLHGDIEKLAETEGVPDRFVKLAGETADVVQNVILEEVPFEEGAEKISENVMRLQSMAGAPGDESGGDMHVNAVVDEELVKKFADSQASLLGDFEAAVIEYEKGNADKLGELKRRLHTWKGEAGVLGLMELQEFLHAIEEGVAEKTVTIDGLLALKDYLVDFFTQLSLLKVPDIPDETRNAILKRSPEMHTRKAPATTAEAAKKAAVKEVDFSKDKSLMLDFISESGEHLEAAENALMELERDRRDIEVINRIFRSFHTIKGVSGFLGLHEINKLAHCAETFLDKGRKKEIVLEPSHIDVFFDALDLMRALVEAVANALGGDEFVLPQAYADVLARISAPDAAAPEGGAARAPSAGEEAEGGKDAAAASAAAPAQGVLPKKRGGKKGHEVADATIRVSTNKLDGLIDMIGELVIANSMKEAKRTSGTMDKIVRDLQGLTMSLRMVTVQAAFQKMARVVRDLARKSGKQVEYITSGEDTELDRNVVDQITDPLVHMIRNSLDHGLESPEERRRAGKVPVGKLWLRAYHEGGSVFIEVEDDGRGLDRAKILEKARKAGIVREDQDLAEHHIDNLIFHAGLSTAKVVTDVSGRGVGMDVVKKNIEYLRGRVDITSTPGRGTKFSMQLPLTLAIIEGMVVQSGRERYIIPMLSIVECFKPREEDVSNVAGRGEMVMLRGELLPIFRLNRLFGLTGAVDRIEDATLIVIEGGGGRCALVVDELLGQQQVVIKTMDNSMVNVSTLSGATIMGDGKVGLILDASGLVQLAQGAELARK